MELRTVLYLAIILETVSKILCFGLQRQDQKRFAVFYKVKEGTSRYKSILILKLKLFC